MKYIVKNCPLYEQYDYFNIGRCKNSNSCNGIHTDFCKDISNCLLKQIVEKCKSISAECFDQWCFANYILESLEIEEVNE